jgi:hypothetical protein
VKVAAKSIALTALCMSVAAAQTPSTSFTFEIDNPTYQPDLGPKVAIDAAHLNFHTADGGYAPFAELLRRDGYRVSSNQQPFDAETLARIDVLVIANAMHEESAADWAALPNHSAFSEKEIVEVETWVRGGGALLLIADHMPLAGHAEALAAAFGVRLLNGFALHSKRSGTITFRRSTSSLAANAVANGRNANERVDFVTTFTGHAFRVDPSVRAEPLLILPSGYELLLPEVAFKFSDRTPRVSATNLLQGVILYHGKGRVAVFGEAAMFTAQLGGAEKRPVGMNAPEARQNPRYALNVLHWLTGVLK